MKKHLKKIPAILVGLFAFVNLQAQNSIQEELFIEPLKDEAAVDVQGGVNCNLGDVFVTIKSDIPNLTFDSNVVDIARVNYDGVAHEYVFCHKEGRFILTISSPIHISKEIQIEGTSTKYAFKVVSKQPTGKIFFKTNPDNAFVDFRRDGLSPQLTSTPIEMNSGEYNVRITKMGYLPFDTTVLVPSDGTTKMVDISLKQDFAKIQLDISTSDNSQFQMYPVIDIDTAHVNMADMFDNAKLKSFNDDGRLDYFKLYKGGYIPVPAGAYNISISTPGFQTYSTIIRAVKGVTTPLVVKLQPVVGYLTVIDNGNANGTKIKLDGQEIGTVPLFKYKARIGAHRLTFEKPGFLSPEKEYKVTIGEEAEEEMSITMTVFKEYYITSEPSGAEVLVDKRRVGFTPANVHLNEGKHEMLIKSTGCLDDIRTITVVGNATTNIPDTIKCKMLFNYPITIKSERKELSIYVKDGSRIVSPENAVTPAELKLPHGRYKLILKDGNFKRFSGTFTHNGKTVVNVPCYSSGTFTTLVGDYINEVFESEDTITNSKAKKYSLLANAQFGRFNLFPGLSTSILRASVFRVNQDFKNKPINAGIDEKGLPLNVENSKYDEYMFAGSCLFLNGEFRAGCSILKNLDICALATYVWYPSLTKVLDINHVDGQEMFFGIELSSRISYLNMNIKLGKEIYKGNYNFLVNKDPQGTADKFYSEKFDFSGAVLSVGFTLGRHVSNSNNMLRVWQKPLISSY